jgi:hypothetical protein
MNEAHPLYLDGFDDARTLALKGTIAKGFLVSSLTNAQPGLGSFTNFQARAVPDKNGFYVSLTNTTTHTAIRLGLKDEASPADLKAFPGDFFR